MRQFLRFLIVVMALVSAVADESQAQVVMRRDITSLSPPELQSYRDAFRQLQQNGEYARLAGHHGCPDQYCHNDSRIFLPWHRAYMLEIEKALQGIDSSLALHYWDWTSSDAIMNGIPSEFTDLQYQSGGTNYPNPLRRFRYNCGDENEFTSRSPDFPFRLGDLRDAVNAAYGLTTYANFNGFGGIQGPHGGLHVWVGGEMGGTFYAAYDPIFWAHHSNVDRQWARWQDTSNGADPTSTIQSLPLAPFGVLVREVLDYRSLGYEYDQLVSPTVLVGAHGSVVITAFQMPADGVPVSLYVHNMPPHPSKSFRVYVFIDQPGATVDQAVQNNPNYAGFFGIFGAGREGTQQHKQHVEPPQAERALDLTSTIRRVVAQGARGSGKVDMKITLVATDTEGEIVEVSELPFDRISVRADEKKEQQKKKRWKSSKVAK